jgi:hypothetical protein
MVSILKIVIFCLFLILCTLLDRILCIVILIFSISYMILLSIRSFKMCLEFKDLINHIRLKYIPLYNHQF